MYILYKITNSINNRFYVGVHCGTPDDSYLGSGLALQRAIKKYGREYFTKEILNSFETAEEAFEAERALVTEEFLKNPLTYNLALGGRGGQITPLTEAVERARNLGRKNKGRKHTPESRANISRGLRGRIRSLESREKTRQALSGRNLSTEHRTRISVARLGTKDSFETREKKRQAAVERAKRVDMGFMRGKQYSILECPHCHKNGGANLMKRYHFTNCKHAQTTK